MKKFTIIALALCLAVALSTPVMAVDADFSGAYRVRGMYTEHWDLRDTSASNAFMNMRFRLQTVFKASDILSVTVRIDALDGSTWGDATATAASFDRAYMTIKTDFGKFDIGRQKGGTWGTTFIDNEADVDRIKLTKTIDDLTLYLVFQKTTEKDGLWSTDTPTDDVADYDSDTYYFLAKQKMENLTAGVLLAFNNDKTNADQTTHKYSAIPYFVGKFGPLAIQGELAYNWGETDYDTVGAADLDFKELAYNLEASFNLGPASLMAGYAFISGDNDGTDDNEDSAYGNVGGDWEKLFILTTDEVDALVNLGGYGNLSDNGITASGSTAGAKILYGGATFSPLDNLTLGVVVGKADADKAPATYKDDYGVEYDFTLNWKIYDNLTYNAIVAFLDAGDYFYQGTTKPDNFEDTYALFHQLQLSF